MSIRFAEVSPAGSSITIACPEEVEQDRAVDEDKVQRTTAHCLFGFENGPLQRFKHYRQFVELCGTRILQLNSRSRITLSKTGEIEEKRWGLWPLAACMNHSCRPCKVGKTLNAAFSAA